MKHRREPAHRPVTASPPPRTLWASAVLGMGTLLWTVVFFSHLPVVLDAAIKNISAALPWPFSQVPHWVGTGCDFSLHAASFVRDLAPQPLSDLMRKAWLPDACGLDFAFWPTGFETPKAWVLAAGGILAGLLALVGGALRRRGGDEGIPEKTPTPLSPNERRTLAAILAVTLLVTLAADRAIAGYLADPAWWAWLRNASAGLLPPFGSIVGIPEKYHGLLFWWGVAGLWLAFRTAFSPEGRRKAARVALATLAATGAYALAQRLGADPLGWETRVDLVRVFATMGNPNYYAGLLLPGAALALWAFDGRWACWGVAAVLTAVLAMTGSLTGLALLAAWGLWAAARRGWEASAGMVRGARIAVAAGITLLFTVGALSAGTHTTQSYGILRHAPWACQDGVAAQETPRRACLGSDWQWVGDAQKWKGFVARGYIWASVWDSFAESPKTFLLGRGPDSLKPVFEKFRRPELKGDYEDPRYVADRAHNWMLDMWHSFGLLGLLAFCIPAALAARRLRGHQKTALVLWAAFFLVNIPVSANWALAALILAGAGRDGDAPGKSA